MKILLYFFIFSVVYNLLRNFKISFLKSRTVNQKQSKMNYKKNKGNFDIVDAEYEEIN
tara:strand:- start:685 stop:858 length:174 start_codon:yes stop_codon:yes gene_type:complete